MKTEIIERLTKSFEEYARNEQGVEYWMARDMQALLEYDKWSNFINVIDKAKISCEKAGQKIVSHFADVVKVINVGVKEAEREIEDIRLTRYACYLIAQNGDPRKASIAFAQSYFALQTRKQELLEKRIEMTERLIARDKLTQTETELSTTLYEHGVDDRGFARIRSEGDKALFGGNSTKTMKSKLKVPESRPLADFLPTITIKAKDFAGEITNFNVKRENLLGENKIAQEHVKNNKDVRNLLVKKSIYPENLPVEEDIKKLERRIKKEDEQFLLKGVANEAQ